MSFDSAQQEHLFHLWLQISLKRMKSVNIYVTDCRTEQETMLQEGDLKCSGMLASLAKKSQ